MGFGFGWGGGGGRVAYECFMTRYGGCERRGEVVLWIEEWESGMMRCMSVWLAGRERASAEARMRGVR